MQLNESSLVATAGFEIAAAITHQYSEQFAGRHESLIAIVLQTGKSFWSI